jgi:glycosyltransferase involved in cell wall biosynthesis
MGQPLVSVVMPLYNTALYVSESIQSILNQTYQNIELIIVNDGSTDNSEEVALSFSDSRIKYYRNEENRKIVYTRNRAIELAQGEYIAFLDSDDISSPERIKLQVDFLENNAKYGFVGSNIQNITLDEIVEPVLDFPSDNDLIRCIMLFRNTFCASAVMFRREAIVGEKFDPEFPVAEDYDIYLRILDKGWLCTNLKTALTFYRIHGQNITLTKKQLLDEKDIQLLKRQLDKLALKYTDEELRYYFLLGKIDVAEYYIEYLRYNFYDVNELLSKIVFANINSGFLNNNTLIVFLFKYWNDSFVAINSYNYSLYSKIKKSPFYDKLSLVMKVKFRVKCLINFSKG